MAAPASVRCVNQISGMVINAGLSGVSGYIGARLFTKINPMEGALFGLVRGVVGFVTTPIFKSIFARPGADGNSQCLGEILDFATSTAVSLAACSALGVHLTVHAAVALIISQAAAAIFTTLLFGSCIADCLK